MKAQNVVSLCTDADQCDPIAQPIQKAAPGSQRDQFRRDDLGVRFVPSRVPDLSDPGDVRITCIREVKGHAQEISTRH